VLHKMLDRELAFGTFNAAGVWGKAARFIRLYRRVANRPDVMDKLEALAAIAQTHREPERPRMPD
jgi:hypothetical protein